MAEQPTRLRVTQTRSTIGAKRNQRETLRTLGLKRIHHAVVRVDSPEVRGMVDTVSHLVSVQEVGADEAGGQEVETS